MANTTVVLQRRLNLTADLPSTRRQHMSPAERAYAHTFAIALILCLTPSKAIGYAAPYLAAMWYCAETRDARMLFNNALYLGAISTLLVVHVAVNPTFLLQNALLWVVTSSSLAILITLPTRSLRSPALLEALLSTCSRVIVLESLVGIAQALYSLTLTGSLDGSNGDSVMGTLDLSVTAANTFSNPIFAVNLATLLLFLLPFTITTGRRLWVVGLGLVALILASVLHVFLLASASGALAWFLLRPTGPKHITRYVGALVVGALLLSSYGVLYKNLTNIGNITDNSIKGRTSRSVVVQRAFSIMPNTYPYMPFVGLGPGQFCSRAALIGSGYYFGSPLSPKAVPGLTPQMSEPMERFLWDLWYANELDPYRSALTKPYLSILAVYTEFGFIPLVVLAAVVLRAIWRVRHAARSKAARLQGTAFVACATFLVLLGFTESYWEVPQAVLVCVLLLKCVYATAIGFSGQGRMHGVSLQARLGASCVAAVTR